ncbi:hypothetical protein BH24CHL9_BH24CHL9_16130 [soil metagenome]
MTGGPEPSAPLPRAAGRTPALLDRGAIFAGWVGLGMALIIAISFELIVAVQPLVFLAAPLAGVLIGYYANQRSMRWRPRRRVLVNATYAGLMTGIGLAVIYVAIRLLFVYADSGFRPVPMGGQLECRTGPECTFARLVAEGHAPDLAEAGITDAATFEAAVLREQADGALWIIGLTTLGAMAASGVRAGRRPPEERQAPPAAVELEAG